MKFALIAVSILCVLSCVMTANVLADDMLDWTELPELPAELGVAGPFAGVSQDALIVAGGANFPNGVPWDGGEKVWYDDIYVLDRTEGEWRTGFSMILGLLGGGLGGLFVLGIFTRRANGPGAIVGLLASGVVQYAVKTHTALHSFMFALTGMVSCVVIGYLVSFFFPRAARDLDDLTLFTVKSAGNDA